MNSSMVAQAMAIRESDGEVEMDYPVPMSPFAGELSKEVELQRALVAEAAMKSGPAIGRENVLFEDDWLMIVNKPRGLYCEHVFATVPSLCSSSGMSLILTDHCTNRLLLLCFRTFKQIAMISLSFLVLLCLGWNFKI
jgi:hypothetical protein